ncbi:hypothetical protein Pcinc_043386 [Petrolisthes cinctipes]|uniref:Uncharacterized protein n=1 Tax=Petrolisthes cinctipes TaxID=88211 RepID=A0AAE1BHR6_PETCI|nr:hypothetical protein Pcinc_043386 [Petrolisthes cinctipes]
MRVRARHCKDREEMRQEIGLRKKEARGKGSYRSEGVSKGLKGLVGGQGMRPHAEPHVLGCCGIMQPLHPGIIASDGRRHKNHLIGVGGRLKTPGINTSVGRLGE